MGVICVKKPSKQDLESSRNLSLASKNHSNTIQTKMDKNQYKRLQIIKEALIKDSNSPSKSIRQQQNQRQISDFKFIRHLGDGSYGQVVMVKDVKSGELYAMKIIKKQLIIQRQQILNALSQRYILAAMDHPFVVKLHYAFQTKNKIYLIVDLMAGGELFYLLRKNKLFTEETTKFYAAQILLALQYLHSKNIIYRDLKPQNILLDKQGHVKITDFGLSKVCLKNNQVTTSICGTPQYIAPQVLKGKGYSLTADWFSFGSLIYDMLTGKPPFYSKDKEQMMSKIQTKQIPFPDHLSEIAKSLLKSLFEKKQQNRLGFKKDAEQIKNHQFFKSINFDDIYHKKLKTPFSFQDAINSQGFVVKFDELAVQQSYEKEMVQKSKGVNFEGFTYQVKGANNQQQKVEISEFELQRNNEQKQNELSQDIEAKERLMRQEMKQQMNLEKQGQQKEQMQKDQDIQRSAGKQQKYHKKSTFSMSMHRLQTLNGDKIENQEEGKPKNVKTTNQQALQVIKEHQNININQTFDYSQSVNKKVQSFQHKRQ